MFLERFKEVENFTITKLPLVGSKNKITFFIFISAYMFSALILFISMPLLPIVIDVWLPINGSRPKIFILEGDYIVDSDENYIKIYAFEAYICVMTVLIFTVIDSTYAVVIEQCVGLINVVKYVIENFYVNK